MKLWQKLFAIFWQPLKVSITRFPEAIITGFILGFLTILNNELDLYNFVLNDINRALSLVIPLWIVHTLLKENLPRYLHLQWFGFATMLLIAISIFVFLRGEMSITVQFNRYTNLLYAFYLMPIFVPFLFGKPNIETGIILIFTRLFLSLLYAGLLYLGIFIVLISANVLFSLSLRLIVYANILTFIATFIFIPLFLGMYPKASEPITVKKDFHIIWQRIFMVVVLPVITVFMFLVILYLVTGIFASSTYETEVYTFSTLVIAFAGISTQVALTPFVSQQRFVKWYVRYFHFGLLIVMAGYYVEQIQMIVRVGISLSVVIQLLLGVWPVAYVIFKLLKQKQAVQRGLLMLVGMFTWIAAMPGLNAVSITSIGLRGQLNQLLTTNDMLDSEGNILAKDPLPEGLYDDLMQTLDEMNRLGLQRFPQLPNDYRHPDDFDTTFGFKTIDPTNPEDEILEFNLMAPILDLSDFAYDQLIYISSIHTLKEGTVYDLPPTTLSLTMNQTAHSYVLNVQRDNDEETIDLYEEVALVLKARFSVNIYESEVKEEFLVSFTFSNFELDVWVMTCISMQIESYADFNIGFYLGISNLGN
jgi:hypothetical protein